jgi:hypothetical protein
MIRCKRRTFLSAVGMAALPFLMGITVAPARAALERMASLEGRLVQVSEYSIGIIDSSSGKVVHFLLEAHFGEAYATDERTQIPLRELRMNSRVKIIYDLGGSGPRRAERVIVLNHH